MHAVERPINNACAKNTDLLLKVTSTSSDTW